MHWDTEFDGRARNIAGASGQKCTSLGELDARAVRLNVSRQAVIKTLLETALRAQSRKSSKRR